MTGRWLYRSFWTFYDHLGTYVFFGLLAALVASAMWLVAFVFPMSQPIYRPSLLESILLRWLGFSAPLMVLSSAFFPHARAAADDRPVRWRDNIIMFKKYWWRYFRYIFLIACLGILLHSNVLFYAKILADTNVSNLGLVIYITGNAITVFGSLFIFTMILSLGELAEVERPVVRNAFKRGVIALLLQPALSIVTLATGVFLVALTLYFQLIGFILFPLVAVLISTCMFLVNQYADNLAAAREKLGPGQPIRAYKKRARDLGMEWEARQPRRTLREMIKPWE